MIFRVMVFAFLAIIGIAFLMMIVVNLYPAIGTTISCRLYQSITGIVPSPQETRPTLPWYCYPSECSFTRRSLEVTSSNELAEAVAFQAYRCWRCAEMGEAPRDVLCAELYSEETTDEDQITTSLIENGHCNVLPNSEMEYSEGTVCGDKNKLFLNSRQISGTIVVKYDSYAHRIMIS